MSKYYIREELLINKTASCKAREDCEDILRQEGYKQLTIKYFCPSSQFIITKAIRQIIYIICWALVYIKVSKSSYLVIQHPLKQHAFGRYKVISALKHKKQVKIIRLIHDIETLRNSTELKHLYHDDRYIASLSDAVICHNPSMKDYLIGMGVEETKLFTLNIFDYLLCQEPQRRIQEKSNTVIIAGNLDSKKSTYLGQLNTIENVRFNLYGIGYTENTSNKNITYFGSYQPEELPQVLQGAFGLVWDGSETDTCGGAFGEYLKYNNPHKLSLYLVSKIPVIVWSRSAVAQFVKKNNIGICVEGLQDIGTRIAELSEEDYNLLQNNAAVVGSHLMKGEYLKTVIKEIENKL